MDRSCSVVKRVCQNPGIKKLSKSTSLSTTRRRARAQAQTFCQLRNSGKRHPGARLGELGSGFPPVGHSPGPRLTVLTHSVGRAELLRWAGAPRWGLGNPRCRLFSWQEGGRPGRLLGNLICWGRECGGMWGGAEEPGVSFLCTQRPPALQSSHLSSCLVSIRSHPDSARYGC